MRILITGGSGFLGQALARTLLARGDEVIVLSRHPQRHARHRSASRWVADLQQIDAPVDAVINLAGENLFARPWTTGRRMQLRDSRIAFTASLVSWICSQAQTPRVFLSGSAIGFYGDRGEQILTEDAVTEDARADVSTDVSAEDTHSLSTEDTHSAPGEDTHSEIRTEATQSAGFMEDTHSALTEDTHSKNTLSENDSAVKKDWASTLVADWERATAPAQAAGVRTVLLRTGLVLGKGGMLQPLLPLFRAGLGGSLGDGRFWYSWIHLQDWVAATVLLLDSEEARGPFNLTAPNPVRYEEFARSLGAALHRPVWLTPPAWLLRLLLGERAALLLGSTRALPERLRQLGFHWQFEHLPQALDSLVN